MAELAIASSVAGFISLGIEVFSGLREYCGSFKDAGEDVKKLSSTLDGLRDIFEIINNKTRSAKFAPEIVEQIDNSINSCASDISTLQKKLSKFRKAEEAGKSDALRAKTKTKAKELSRRFQYPFAEKTLRKLQTTVSNLLSNVAVAVQCLQIDVSAHTLEKLDASHDHIVMIRAHQEEESSRNALRDLEAAKRKAQEEKKNILDWMTKVSPATFTEPHLDASNKRTPGTRGWLLQSAPYKKWIAEESSRLWCPGIPGSGKTVSM